MTVTITSLEILMLRVSEMMRFSVPVMMTLLLVSVFYSRRVNNRAKSDFFWTISGYIVFIKTDSDI